MSNDLSGVITWLKDWFYEKSEVYTKSEVDAQISSYGGTIPIFKADTLPTASEQYSKNICIVGTGYQYPMELYICIGE